MNASAPVTKLLASLKGVKRTGDSIVAKCPAHDDGTASLSIAEGRDGRAILKCHAGCTTEAVVAAAGLELRDLFDASTSNGTGKQIVAEYRYEDENSHHLYDVVKFSPKDFRQRAASGAWSLKDVPRKVPYRLPALIEGVKADRTVFIVEGEKDCDRLVELGLVATTNSGGAGKWRPEYSEHFRGARVVILPDNDTPGRDHARDVAAKLVPIAKDVRVVELPGIPDKGDVSDWLGNGGTAAELKTLVRSTPTLNSPSFTTDSEESDDDEALGQDQKGAYQRGRPYKLAELYQFPELLTPPPAIIPGIAYAGRVTLKSGREKSGKSTLMGQAIAALSRGGRFLDEVLSPLPSLWYAIDEPLGDSVQRFRQFDANPETTHVFDQCPTADEMRAEIESTGAKIVVVDTLTELWRGKIKSENDASEIGPFLRPFVEVARETGVALVLLYHATKSGGGYRGSADIGATVDLILNLRQPGTAPNPDAAWDDVRVDDGRRVLEGKGRGGISVNTRLTFDGTGYSVGDAPMPLRSRILSELAIDPASGSALAERFGTRKQAVLAEVRDLKQEGLVEAHGRIIQLSQRGLASVPTHDRETLSGTDRNSPTQPIETELFAPELGRNRSGTDSGTGDSANGSRPNDIGTNAGTVTTRTIEVDGRIVTQRLRLTQHGDEWRDEEAAA
ncbi:MAG: AAA family ATPase [Gemmatimonadaceae bacterium]|nr:AAA family ATPase [Gemmatimonadaceae bacterium]